MVLQARPIGFERFNQFIDRPFSAKLRGEIADQSVPLMVHQRPRMSPQGMKNRIAAEQSKAERMQRFRRYLIGAYGDVQWTRNLRAAGEADFRLHGRTDHVTARELDREAATEFFRATLPGFIRSLPWFGRRFAAIFLRLVGPELLTDPERAAITRPVFEII